MLLHELVDIQARNGEVQPSEYKSVPVHTFGVRLRWFHERKHTEAVR